MKEKKSLSTLIIIVLLSVIVIGLSSYIVIDKINENKKYDDEITQMTIYLEGMEEKINVKKFKSILGFSIRYDIDRFEIFEEKSKVLINTIYSDDIIRVTVEKIKSSYEEITTKINSFEEIFIN